jgi:hypothetical protein
MTHLFRKSAPAAVASAPADGAPEDAPHRPGATILIVDDSPTETRIFVNALVKPATPAALPACLDSALRR